MPTDQPPITVEQMVRDLLDSAIAEGIVAFCRESYGSTRGVQSLTAADLVYTANLLAKFLRSHGERETTRPAG